MFERKWTFFKNVLKFVLKYESISSCKFLIIWWIQEKPLSMFWWKSIWINKVLKLAKKNKQTNQKNIANTYKKKTNQAKTRFSAFHWITVFFLVKSSLWFYPNFALSVITYHITCYIRMRSERHFPYEKIVLNDGFP